MLMLLSNWRTYVVAALISGGAWLGWSANDWLTPASQAPTPVTNTVVVERVVTRTVTVTKQPDGTVTETTTETTADTSSSTSKPAPVSKPKWSAEAIAEIRPAAWREPTWAAMGYHRLADTNAWVGMGWDNGSNAVLAGVRVDF